jgi:ubiquinone/menaquinone biosynthesis C-methylase UbiE
MGKDYQQESNLLHTLIEQHKRSTGNTLLDVACGTGGHLAFLRERYTAAGLDASAAMLAVARQRFPEMTFHEASMSDFDLGRQFDVITCLFSAIGYVKTVDKLYQAVATMTHHLRPGGVLIIEPWLYPDGYYPGTVHATFVDEPALKIARMVVSQVRERVSVMEMNYLVATPEGVEHFVDRHELGLFTIDDYLAAFRTAGLTVTHDPVGFGRRGLYIGAKHAA